jgi:hypothetical protein
VRWSFDPQHCGAYFCCILPDSYAVAECAY